MKKLVSAGMAGLLIFAAQAAAAQDSVNLPVPASATHAACDQRLDRTTAAQPMVLSAHDQVVRSCDADDHPNDGVVAGVGFALLAGGIVALAVTRNNDNNTASP